MKERTINWGILGPGKIARKFAKGLQEVEHANLLSVASRSLERAQDFAAEYPAQKVFSSYEEMLQDEELDVVYVATPHAFHYDHTLLCLRHKKAVLCEKPFALNRREIEEMIATAKREQVFLMEAMWTQFLPHINFVLDLISDQRYGKIKNLKADFGFSTVFDARSRLYDKSLGGGSLMDIGIYPVFLALVTLGKPEKITASSSMASTGVDEDCNIIFHYPGQVRAELNSSIIKKTPTTAQIELEEATLFIHSRFHEPSSVSITTSQGVETKNFEVHSNGYDFEARHVQEMLQAGKIESDVMTFAKSLDLIDLLDGIRKEIDLRY